MNKITVVPLFFLVGCASSPDPYPVEPQSVTVHFLSESEWRDRATQLTLDGVTWGMPGDLRGFARWEKNENGKITNCKIFFPAESPPSRYTLTHELKHCAQGDFHP